MAIIYLVIIYTAIIYLVIIYMDYHLYRTFLVKENHNVYYINPSMSKSRQSGTHNITMSNSLHVQELYLFRKYSRVLLCWPFWLSSNLTFFKDGLKSVNEGSFVLDTFFTTSKIAFFALLFLCWFSHLLHYSFRK